MNARRTCATLIGLSLLAFATEGYAQVSARLTIDGACPSRLALERSLRGVARSDPRGRWELRVVGDLGATEVVFLEPGGSVALTRQLPGGSCTDRANAIAVILHAHLLDLSLVAPDALERAVDQVEPDPAPGVEQTSTESAPPPEDQSADSVPATSEGGRVTERSSTEGGYLLGLAGAVGLGLAPSLFAGHARIELGWDPGGFPLVPRLEIGGSLFEDQAAQEGELTLRRFSVGLVGSLPMSLGSTWVAPTAGAAFVTDFVGFGELTAVEPRMRVTVGAELGWAVAGPFWIRVDARLDVFPWADDYRVEPIGSVGQSPQLIVSLGAALGVRFDDS